MGPTRWQGPQHTVLSMQWLQTFGDSCTHVFKGGMQRTARRRVWSNSTEVQAKEQNASSISIGKFRNISPIQCTSVTPICTVVDMDVFLNFNCFCRCGLLHWEVFFNRFDNSAWGFACAEIREAACNTVPATLPGERGVDLTGHNYVLYTVFVFFRAIVYSSRLTT